MLHFETRGSADLPNLIFMHGLSASSAQITAALTDLSGRHLIAPDMPGHGRSLDFDPDEFSFDHSADQIIEMMNRLEIEKSDLGGISMGSGIALNLALRYPERVEKIIVLRPAWLDSPRPEHLQLIARIHQGMKLDDPEFQKLNQENPSVAATVASLISRTNEETVVLEKIWSDAPFSSLDELAKIIAPALVLSSPRDELHPLHIADKISSCLKNSQITVLPARYYQSDDYHNQLNAQINEFLLQP